MANTPKILAFSGSLRSASWNHSLVSLAAKAARDAGAEVEVIKLIDYQLPLFNEDTEATLQTLPALVALREKLSSCDGLLISNPEYNGSLSAALKNTIDWLTRPGVEGGYEPSFTNKIVGVLSASPADSGGIRSASHLRDVLAGIGCEVVPEQVTVGAAYQAFGEDNQLLDATIADAVVSLAHAVVKTIPE
ncbi:MAG: NAD(P)H-dependent oxidoreductase [Pseudomonadales bacterium]|nr:NAD(P)H-dependent oxidoreductase [Pseudomonadales bacterium]